MKCKFINSFENHIRIILYLSAIMYILKTQTFWLVWLIFVSCLVVLTMCCYDLYKRHNYAPYSAEYVWCIQCTLYNSAEYVCCISCALCTPADHVWCIHCTLYTSADYVSCIHCTSYTSADMGLVYTVHYTQGGIAGTNMGNWWGHRGYTVYNI